MLDQNKEYTDSVDEIADIVGQDFDDMTDSLEEARQATEDLSSAHAQFMQQLKDEAGVVAEWEGTMDNYIQKLQDAENGARAVQAELDQLRKDYTEKESEAAYWQDLATNPNKISSGTGNDGGGGGVGGTSYDFDTLAEGIAGNIHVYGTWANEPNRSARLRQKFGDELGNQLFSAIQGQYINPWYWHRINNFHHDINDWQYFRQFDVDRFDTGGYTGDWDNSGRLAFLHQKELVLNAVDTKNLLAAVNSVRMLTQNLKGSLLPEISTLDTMANYREDLKDVIEQRVEITAEFPAVNSAYEIEQALLGLADQTYQYANRRSLGK